MNRTANQATVRDFSAYRLAGEANREQLFAALEKFANVGDGVEEYRSFGRQSSYFWPVPLSGSRKEPEWTVPGHKLFLAYRNALRHVWRSDQVVSNHNLLSILLGIDHVFLMHVALGEPGHGPITDSFSAGWHELNATYPEAQYSSPPSIAPSWRSGEFHYTAVNDFQTAVYILFRESWRAKICVNCSAYFVAEKPARLYCSTRCSAEIKKKRGLQWWRNKGAEKRRSRSRPVEAGPAGERSDREGKRTLRRGEGKIKRRTGKR